MENNLVSIQANSLFSNDINTIELSEYSLNKLLTEDQIRLLKSRVIYLRKYNSYTFESLADQFGLCYEDPVANEWSNNRVHFYEKGSTYSNVIAAMVFAIGLTGMLYGLKKPFTILLNYTKEEFDCPKVTFYCNRKGIEDVIEKNNLEAYGEMLFLISLKESKPT